MRLLLVALVLFSMPAQGQDRAVPAATATQSSPHQATGQPSTPKPDDPPPTPRGESGGFNLALTFVIAFAACVQAGVAIWQAKIYKRQYGVMAEALRASNKSAEASAKSVAALERLERPFLIVEVREKDQVWLVNKGKVPAQIVWYNDTPDVLILTSRERDELPNDYFYGTGFDDPRAEILNSPWIAPREEWHLCTFDPSILPSLMGAHEDARTRIAITVGSKLPVYLSAIKYRGVLTDSLFQSRWCFTWKRNEGLRRSGPYGFNSYS